MSKNIKLISRYTVFVILYDDKSHYSSTYNVLQKQSYGKRRAFINIGDSVCEVSIVGFLIMLTRIPLVLLTKLGKRPLQLDLESKGQGHRKNQMTYLQSQKEVKKGQE